MNEKKLNLNKTMLCLLVLCVCQFFAIFKISDYIYKADLINVSTILVTCVIFFFTFGKIFFNKDYDNQYNKIIILYGILVLVEIFHSYFLYRQYGQSFFSTLLVSVSDISVIVFFPFCYLQNKIRNKDYLKECIKVFGFICSFLSLIQVFMYQYGIIFLDIAHSSIRYDTLRFSVGGYLVSIALIISLFDYFNKGHFKDIIFVITYVLFFFFASKTRSEILYILFSIIISIILFLKNKKIKYSMIFISIVSIVVLLSNGFIQKYVFDLSNDVGVNVRYNTISYYMNQFYERPLLGMGYINTGLNRNLDILYYGYDGYYYRDDVGIVGLLNEKGILGGLLYISFLFASFRMTHKLYIKDKNKYIWLLAIMIYMSFCSINLIYLNSLRITTAMLIFSMIHHYYFLDILGGKRINYEK